MTRYEKKNIFLICFLQSFCLNLKYFENPFLTRFPQRNALLGAGEAVQIHVIRLKGMVELEILIIIIIIIIIIMIIIIMIVMIIIIIIIIISNGNRAEWSTI